MVAMLIIVLLGVTGLEIGGYFGLIVGTIIAIFICRKFDLPV